MATSDVDPSVQGEGLRENSLGEFPFGNSVICKPTIGPYRQ